MQIVSREMRLAKNPLRTLPIEQQWTVALSPSRSAEVEDGLLIRGEGKLN